MDEIVTYVSELYWGYLKNICVSTKMKALYM